jgi:hypothetical protein
MTHINGGAKPDAGLADPAIPRPAGQISPQAGCSDGPSPDRLDSLSSKHEAFARAYAQNANGAAAARSAGYASGNAKNQGAALLRRGDVTMRVAELDAEIAAERRDALSGFVAKLEPVFDAALEAGDHDTALQTVELQARITGLIHGGATVRPRSGRGAKPATEGRHESFLELLD